MFTLLYNSHKLAVTLFVAIYAIKTLLLVLGQERGLEKFNKFIRIPEMIASLLFLITGSILVLHVANFGFLFVMKLLFIFSAIPLAVIAFKKQNRLLGLISLLLLAGAYGLAEVHKVQFGKRKAFTEEVITNPEAPNYVLSLHGKALYNAQCAVCHGEDGTAGLSGAKNLQKSQMTSEQIEAIINSGKNTMPRMEGKYDELEMKALVQYVKEFRIQ